MRFNLNDFFEKKNHLLRVVYSLSDWFCFIRNVNRTAAKCRCATQFFHFVQQVGHNPQFENPCARLLDSCTCTCMCVDTTTSVDLFVCALVYAKVPLYLIIIFVDT